MPLGYSAGRGRKSPVRPSAKGRATLRQRHLIDPPIPEKDVAPVHDLRRRLAMMWRDAWPVLALMAGTAAVTYAVASLQG